MKKTYITKTLVLALCWLVFGNNLSAQDTLSELRIGEWQQHLPWQRAVSVTNSPSKVYYATELSVVEIDKAERSPRYLYKTEGFNDINPRLVRYNGTANVLFIAYANSNIDLYYPTTGQIVNLPFIQKNTVLSGDKGIKNVFFDGAFAYVSTGFGMVKLDLAKAEVEYSVLTGIPVFAFASYRDQYYMGTEEGLYRLPTNDVNPADFGRWQLLGPVEGFETEKTVNAMAVFENFLYIGMAENGLLRYNGLNKPDAFAQYSNSDVNLLTTEGAGMVVGWRKGGDVGAVFYLEPDGAYYEIQGPCDARRPKGVVEDGNKKFWFADEFDDFRYYDIAKGQCEFFNFNSPYNARVAEIALRGNKVFIAADGADPNLNPTFTRLGIYFRDDDGAWRRYSPDSNPETVTADNTHLSWWRVTPHPTEEKFYIGSFLGGLIEMSDRATDTKLFTKSNSILQNAGAAGPDRTAIGGMAYDPEGNLWICNYSASRPIAVLKPDGILRNFAVTGGGAFTKVAVDGNGYKWFVSAFTGGLAVFDSGDNIDDPSDDRFKIINSSNSVLATNEVLTLSVDLDGDVWVGTKEGLYVFECSGAIFNSENPCRGTRHIITVDGFGGYLLEDESIKTIAVDGGNRKWVGTSNGVFVQSQDGRTTLARYDATNSPIPSNLIEDIAIDDKAGVVWIGTASGLVSVRSEATLGGRIHSLNAYAYPNPVRPDYDGPIAIYGLARDANVKITDMAGQLIYEGTAVGGQAIWNGRDYLGRRAASGVYLVYATSSESFDEPDAIITKVVIVN
jgi:hypothetical protein